MRILHTGQQRALAIMVAVLVAGGIYCDSITAQTDNAAPTGASDDPVTYEQVRPVLKKHCQACHNDDRERGGLDVSTLAGIKVGGASGIVAVPHKPDESLLYTLAAQIETPKMPPNKPKIPQRELDLIRRWIEGGMVERAGSATLPAFPVIVPKQETAAPVNSARPAVGSELAAPSIGVAVDPLPRATAITALAVSPKQSLAAVSGRKQIILFQPAETNTSSETGTKTSKPNFKALPFPEGDVFSLRFSRDGQWLVAGGGVGGLSGKVVGFEVATGRRVFELGDESDVVLALDISPDKSVVALGGPGRSVKMFRTSDGALTATLRKHTDWILSLAFSPEGLLLASGDRFGGLQVWETQSGNEFYTLRGHVGPVTAVDWSTDSERLLSAGQDGTLRFWNMHTGQSVANWNGNVGGILAAQCDASGRVVCSGRNGKIALWDKSVDSTAQNEGNISILNPKPDAHQPAVPALMSMPDEVVKLALNHDATQVFAGDAAGNLAVFSLSNEEKLSQLTLPVAQGLARATQSQRTPIKALPTQQSSPSPVTDVDANISAAESELRRATAELLAVQDLAAKTNAAIKSTEESLATLRESAAKLAKIVTDREMAAKSAALRVAELKARANPDNGSRDRSGPHADRRGASETQSLLDSARDLADRIQQAAQKSPGDIRLQSAAKRAAELRDLLKQDQETATVQ